MAVCPTPSFLGLLTVSQARSTVGVLLNPDPNLSSLALETLTGRPHVFQELVAKSLLSATLLGMHGLDFEDP